jgi:hypothetical protein
MTYHRVNRDGVMLKCSAFSDRIKQWPLSLIMLNPGHDIYVTIGANPVTR